MKALSYNPQKELYTLEVSKAEIENLILYLGHGRYAKALDEMNYNNLKWTESAKIAKKIKDEINDTMTKLNEILNTASNE